MDEWMVKYDNILYLGTYIFKSNMLENWKQLAYTIKYWHYAYSILIYHLYVTRKFKEMSWEFEYHALRTFIQTKCIYIYIFK